MTLGRSFGVLAPAMSCLFGCAGEPRQASPPAAKSALVIVAPPPAVAPGAVTRTTASAPAATPVIPDALANAPRLVYRSLDTGMLNARSTLVTRTLQRFEDQALLTVLSQTSDSSTSEPVLGPFGAPAIRRYLGTATTRGDTTTFSLVDGADKLTLECSMGHVQVAAATAVRKPVGGGQCDGDRGRWQPRATKRVAALRCGIHLPSPDYPADRDEDMAFTAPPGIEFLFVNDDCVMQGGGYRLMPPDGGVGAIRPPGAL
jgi:hypothetical protein